MALFEVVAAILAIFLFVAGTALLVLYVVQQPARKRAQLNRARGAADEALARADRLEEVLRGVLVYALGVADVEPAARVVADTITRSGVLRDSSST
jgi:hypothetical protein